MRHNKVLPGNTLYCGITKSGKKAYIFGASMVSNVNAKKKKKKKKKKKRKKKQ